MAGYVEKEKIPEFDPHPDPPAADVRTVGAGPAAQVFHERKEGFQQAPGLTGPPAAMGQGWFMVADGFYQAGVGFLPLADCVPGDRRLIFPYTTLDHNSEPKAVPREGHGCTFCGVTRTGC